MVKVRNRAIHGAIGEIRLGKPGFGDIVCLACVCVELSAADTSSVARNLDFGGTIHYLSALERTARDLLLPRPSAIDDLNFQLRIWLTGVGDK